MSSATIPRSSSAPLKNGIPSKDLLDDLGRMETEENILNSELKGKVVQIFSDFMARVTIFDELTAAGNRFLVNFQQGLEFIRRSSIDDTSQLVGRVINTNQTSRLRAYINAGCVNISSRVENLNKLHVSHIGLLNNLSQEKIVLSEIEGLVEDLRLAIEAASGSLQDSHHEDHRTDSDAMAAACVQDKMVPIDYAFVVAILYRMVNQDYVMQEKIVTSLNLKTPSGELDGFCLMWSLRPFINDEIMHRAWRLIP